MPLPARHAPGSAQHPAPQRARPVVLDGLLGRPARTVSVVVTGGRQAHLSGDVHPATHATRGDNPPKGRNPAAGVRRLQRPLPREHVAVVVDAGVSVARCEISPGRAMTAVTVLQLPCIRS